MMNKKPKKPWATHAQGFLTTWTYLLAKAPIGSQGANTFGSAS